ncbi:MAG: hypothetical protein V7K27_23100 [Nostoc sp.]
MLVKHYTPFYESGDNIGKMIVIDAETGEYGIDPTGVETALKLKL